MATAHLRSLEVLKESTFGSPDSNGEVPPKGSVTGTWRGLECDRTSIAPWGEEQFNEDLTLGDGFGALPREPNTAWATGGSVRLKREQGDATYTAPLRTALSSDAPLRQLLSTAFYVESSGGGTLAISASGANAGECQTLSALKVGAIVLVEVDGRIEAGRVTKVTGSGPYTITFGTYFSRLLTTNDVLKLGATFSVCTGANSGLVGEGGDGKSVALHEADLKGTTLATGCRQRVTRFYSENGQVKVDGTVQCAFVRNDAASAGTVVGPTRATGAVAHTRKVRPCYSSSPAPGKAASAGFTSTRAALPLNLDWECIVEHTLAPLSDPQTIVEASNLEITMTRATLTVRTGTIQSALLNDFRDQRQRQVVLPAGPITDGASDESGFALILSAAALTSHADLRDLGGETIEQTLTFEMGPYLGDDGSEAWNNAPFAFFLGEV